MTADVGHLGVLLGDPTAPRVVGLSTAAVFADRSLPQAYWGRDAASLDGGVQAHLYTRPGDVLVVRLPVVPDAQRRLRAALDANRAVWRRLLGVELASGDDPLVAVTGAPDVASPDALVAAGHVTWVCGDLDDGVVAGTRADGRAVLLLVPRAGLLDRLAATGRDASGVRDAVAAAERLLDKNDAMVLLAAGDVPSAPTWVFTSGADLDERFVALPDDPGARFVVKPSGGAAGIGVFAADGGAERDAVVAHIRGLRTGGRLPARFQVQRHVPGPVLGATLALDGVGGCRVLEVHTQVLDADARVTATRWSRAHDAAARPAAERVGRALSRAVGVPLVVGVDLVDGVVIEVNPRVTASTPIAHLLRTPEVVEAALGAPVERVDAGTRVALRYEAIAGARVLRAAEEVRARTGALVLPQGIDPFGSTRVVVVNDDEARSACTAFARLVA